MHLWELFASRKEYFLTVITPLLLSLFYLHSGWSLEAGSCPLQKSNLIGLDESYYRYNENNLLSKEILDVDSQGGKICSLFCKVVRKCSPLHHP